MSKELLAAMTAAGTSDEFEMHLDRHFASSISAGGLVGSETVTLEYYDGTTWRDYYQDGESTPEQVTETNSMVTIYAPCRWRATKSVTAAAVAIMLHTKRNP